MNPTIRPQSAAKPVTRQLTMNLNAFAKVGLSDLGGANLLRRQETKYVLEGALIPDLLRGLQSDYFVLEVGGLTAHDYLTLNYDTPTLELFQAHHRGVSDRVKVRERLYRTTDQLFMEVKHRNNKGVTNKTRSRAEAWHQVTDPKKGSGAGRAWTGWSSGRPVSGDLVPTLWTAYQRFTLVRKQRPERVTVDTAVTYSLGSGAELHLNGVAIVEVKQPSVDRGSPVMKRLRAMGVRPGGFSKYCVGVSLLMPEVRHNRFKPRLRTLHNLIGAADAA